MGSTDADTPAILVARFLRSNNYHETLEAFLTEADLPSNTGQAHTDALTIEKVLQEKQVYDLSQRFEKTGVEDDKDKQWRSPAPSTVTQISSISNPSNILHIRLLALASTTMLFVTTADRRSYIISPDSPFTILDMLDTEAPILSTALIGSSHIIATSMSGTTSLYSLDSSLRLKSSRRDHAKYVVHCASTAHGGRAFVATAAWDSRVLLYSLDGSSPTLDAPIAQISLSSNPECIAFVQHPELAQPILLVSRRDSTFLYFYGLPTEESTPSVLSEEDTKYSELPLLGRQNLAPNSNAWIAFTPAAFAVSPRDPSTLAVVTSHVPHMKILIVTLLFPPPPAKGESLDEPQLTATQVSRANLATQDREAAAIKVQVSTLAMQTAYSTPALAWRADGTGVWVNGDDGVVRGVEACSGKIASVLKDGHEAGAKVRCVCAGVADEKEIMVSGGFDRRLCVWTAS